MIWDWDKRRKAQKRIHFFSQVLAIKLFHLFCWELQLTTQLTFSPFLPKLAIWIFLWNLYFLGRTFILECSHSSYHSFPFFFHSNKYILPLFFWLQLFIPILFSCRRLLFCILLLILKHFWPLSHIQANVRETHPLPTRKSICRHFGKKMTTPRQQIIKRENSMPRIKNSYVPFKDKNNKNITKEKAKANGKRGMTPTISTQLFWLNCIRNLTFFKSNKLQAMWRQLWTMVERGEGSPRNAC